MCLVYSQCYEPDRTLLPSSRRHGQTYMEIGYMDSNNKWQKWHFNYNQFGNGIILCDQQHSFKSSYQAYCSWTWSIDEINRCHTSTMNSCTTIDVCPSIGTTDFVNSLRFTSPAIIIASSCIAVSVCTVELTISTQAPNKREEKINSCMTQTFLTCCSQLLPILRV